MNGIRAVTVYCSSSASLHPSYYDAARELGEGLARRGLGLVYGGGKAGMMGAVARACRDGGGRVTGIITERLCIAEQFDEDNHESIVVRTMRERKALLEARGDAIAVLPGGLGTMEEFFEIVVGRLLGEHDMPIVLVNLDDPGSPGRFFDPLVSLIEHMIAGGFARPGIRDLFHVSESIADALAWLDGAPAAALRGDRDALLPGAVPKR